MHGFEASVWWQNLTLLATLCPGGQVRISLQLEGSAQRGSRVLALTLSRILVLALGKLFCINSCQRKFFPAAKQGGGPTEPSSTG